MKFFKYWLPPIMWAGVIFCLSSLPAGALPIRLLHFISSNLAHFLEYMVLGLLSFRALDNSFSNLGFKNVIYAGSFGILYAISDEIHQAFVPTRFCTIGDILLDTLGIIFAFFLIFLWRRYRVY